MEPAPEYYPKLWELLILLAAALQLVAAGELIKRWWSTRNEPLPIPVAVFMWGGMAALYFLVAATFYQYTTPEPRRIVVLFYTILFWLIPLFYFTNAVREAISVRLVDRIGPFSAPIEDPSEFAAARKLALRGDIDGAVARYRSYPENHGGALLEAARLLKSEDRFAEAAELFAEAAVHYYGRKRLWAEAQYHRAKIHEVGLSELETAKELYREILNRAGETRFGEAAGADLARLQALEMDLEAPEPAELAPDPFYRVRGEAPPAPDAPQENATEPTTEEDLVVPEQDPFFRGTPPQPAKQQKTAPRDGRAAKAVTEGVRKGGKKQAQAKQAPAGKKRRSSKKPHSST